MFCRIQRLPKRLIWLASKPYTSTGVPSLSEFFKSKPTPNQLKKSNIAIKEVTNPMSSLHKSKFPTLDELKKLVREDSTLPDSVRPTEGMPLVNISKVSNVFLAGATGTFGPYLLRELSQRPNIKKIYCLVRRGKDASPKDRLLNQLQSFHLTAQVDLTKVECIEGDITEDKFGLTEEVYNRLAGEVDAIFNSAARLSYAAKYYKAPEEMKKTDIRAINVLSTVRILKFATHTKLKHVYHASTILTIVSSDDEGRATEDWQNVGAFDEIPYNWGYPLSKHISDQICKQAVERGIPCKVFRHPLMGGDSKTGRCDYLTNHFVLRWLTYLKLKCMPDSPIPMSYMAVDVCAQISLELFFNPHVPLDVYTISQRETGMDQDIIKVAKEEFGIHIEPVPFAEFVKKAKLLKDSPLSRFHTIYEEDGVMAAVHAQYDNRQLKFHKDTFENASTFYRSRKLPQFMENYDELESTASVMRRDLAFLKESGVFDKLEIKS